MHHALKVLSWPKLVKCLCFLDLSRTDGAVRGKVFVEHIGSLPEVSSASQTQFAKNKDFSIHIIFKAVDCFSVKSRSKSTTNTAHSPRLCRRFTLHHTIPTPSDAAATNQTSGNFTFHYPNPSDAKTDQPTAKRNNERQRSSRQKRNVNKCNHDLLCRQPQQQR